MDERRDELAETERKRRWVIKFAYWALIVLSVVLFGKYILPVLFPFVLAYLLAWALEKPVSWMHAKTRMPRAVVATLFIILIIGGLSGILTLAGAWIFNWIRNAFSLLPQVFSEGIFPTIEYFFDSLEHWVAGIDPALATSFDATVDNVLSILSDSVQKLSGVVLSGVAGLVTGVPQFLMKTLVMFIATVFISSDFRTVKRFLLRLFPESADRYLKAAGTFFGRVVPKYIMSYLMIMLLTFTELLIGFTCMGIKSAPMIAFFVAILDILPVLGTGTVLIPWALFSLIEGRLGFAAGLGAMYVIITVIRQIIEPRLVGAQIKLHPVLTFAAMLTGISLFGFWGLFGLPFGLAFLGDLNQQGLIHIRALDRDPESEKEEAMEEEKRRARKEKRKARFSKKKTD